MLLAALGRLRADSAVAFAEVDEETNGQEGSEDGCVGKGLADVDLDAPDEVDDNEDTGRVDQPVDPLPAAVA